MRKGNSYSRVVALAVLSAALPARALDFSARNREEIERLVASTGTCMMYSSELGWTLRPSSQSGLCRVNSAGLRAQREYSPRPAPGILRVAAFGDSYVYGDDVDGTQTWETFVSSADAGVEVLNYGVPAYGLDQALLRYRREGGRLHPRIVMIGFMVAGLHRNITTFRPFWSPGAGMPFAKPRFILKDGKLLLIPNPLPRLEDYKSLLETPAAWESKLGAHDWFYRRRHGRGLDPGDHGPSLEPGAEGFKVLIRLLEAFCAEVRRDGRIPVILLFPHRPALELVRAGKDSHELLLRALYDRRLDFLDAGEGARRLGRRRR